MNRLRLVGVVAGALLATACATPPTVIDVMPYDEEPFQYPTPAAPMMQHPAAEPIEPAEPPEPTDHSGDSSAGHSGDGLSGSSDSGSSSTDPRPGSD